MIRFLLLAFLFYIFFLIVNSVLNAFFGLRKRQNANQTSQEGSINSHKPKVEYKNVQDAKFEDVKEDRKDEQD